MLVNIVNDTYNDPADYVRIFTKRRIVKTIGLQHDVEFRNIMIFLKTCH